MDPLVYGIHSTTVKSKDSRATLAPKLRSGFISQENQCPRQGRSNHDEAAMATRNNGRTNTVREKERVDERRHDSIK